MSFIKTYINRVKEHGSAIGNILMKLLISAVTPFAFGLVMPPIGFLLFLLFKYSHLYFIIYYIVVFISFFLYVLPEDI